MLLSNHPLTLAYKRTLESRLGVSLETRTLTEFRRAGVWATFMALRALSREPFLLASQDPSAVSHRHLLMIVGGIFGHGRQRLFDHQFGEYSFSRFSAIPGLCRILRDSLLGRWNLLRLTRRLKVMAQSWHPVPWNEGCAVAYLKTNLWFGVKAGGSVGHVAGVVNGLAQAGQDLVVLANEPQDLVDPALPFAPVTAPGLCALPVELDLISYHQTFLDQAKALFRGRHPQWLYQRLSLANFVGAELSRELQLPLVVEYNGSEVWISRNWGRPLRYEAYSSQAEEAMLAQATLVATVSDVLGDELRERGVPPERIFAHANCVDPRMFREDLLTPEEILAAREELSIAEDALVATFLGTFGVWHGATFMAKALRHLYETRGPWLQEKKVHFLMVGDGAYRRETEDILAGLPRVTFTGLVPQEEAPRYLAISNLFLSPHVHAQTDLRFFGSPTKLFEYMAMGKPVLASRLEQIGEILAPGPNGEPCAELFEPSDTDGFLLGLSRLIDDPAYRAQLGERARARVLAEYTWDRYTEKLLNRLRELT